MSTTAISLSLSSVMILLLHTLFALSIHFVQLVDYFLFISFFCYNFFYKLFGIITIKIESEVHFVIYFMLYHFFGFF